MLSQKGVDRKVVCALRTREDNFRSQSFKETIKQIYKLGIKSSLH